MNNSEKIELLGSFGIPVKEDRAGFLVEIGLYNIYDRLEAVGFEYVEKGFDDDTIGTNGEYEISVIATNPTTVDISKLEEFHD